MTKRPAFNMDFAAGDLVAGLKGPAMFYVAPSDIIIDEDFNPRGQFTPEEQAFNAESLNSLAESMRREGVLSPLLVRRDNDDRYHLIAGERRLRAARIAGLTQLPVILKDEQDRYRIALIENLQRENLNPVDETFGILRLLSEETGLTVETLPAAIRQAARAGASDPHKLAARLSAYGPHTLDAWARHRLKFLKLLPAEINVIQSGSVPWRTVTELTRLPENEAREQLLQRITSDKLSFKQVAAEVNGLLGKSAVAPPELLRLFQGIRPDSVHALPASKRERAVELLTELSTLLS